MKKFFIVLLCLIITMPALAIKPPKEYVEKWQKEYEDKLAKCPADKPLYTQYGCISCNDVHSFMIPSYTGDFCSQICPNRKSTIKAYFGATDIWSTYCVLKDAPGPDFYFDEYTQSWIKPKNCPDDKPLYVNGECMACNEYKNLKNIKNVFGCEKCPNKIIKGNSCYLNCPDDKPLIIDGHKEGRCMPCDTPSNFLTATSSTVISGYERCTEQKNTPPFKKSSSNTTRK